MAADEGMRVGKVHKNPLMHRTEMRVQIVGEATVSRRRAKDLLAGADSHQTIIERVEKPFGRAENEVIVRVYEDQFALTDTEPAHLLARDGFTSTWKKPGSWKLGKELKNRQKRVHGTKNHKSRAKVWI